MIVLLTIVLLLAALVAWLAHRVLAQVRLYRLLDGPPAESWLAGNAPLFLHPELFAEACRTYGPVFR